MRKIIFNLVLIAALAMFTCAGCSGEEGTKGKEGTSTGGSGTTTEADPGDNAGDREADK